MHECIAGDETLAGTGVIIMKVLCSTMSLGHSFCTVRVFYFHLAISKTLRQS